MKIFVMLLLIGSLAVSVQADPDPALIRGRWVGTVSQEGMRRFQGQTFYYTIDMLIPELLEGEVSGTMAVIEADCRGELTFQHFADGVFRFLARPVKGSPKHCVFAVLTIKPLPRDKIEVSFTYPTPDNPRTQGLQGTLHRLISMERDRQQDQ